MDIFSLAIIIANVLFSYKGFNDYSFFRKYEFHIGSIRSGEQIRMLTSGFLHADLGHLFFNMFTFYFFAPVITAYLGSLMFLVIYFSSLIFGNLLTLMLYRNDFNYRAIGASGAVTGIVYSAILLRPDMMLGIFFVIPMPAYIFGILYLLYSIYGMKAKNDGIGHAAHFGGAIGGYLITLLVNPDLIFLHPLMVSLLTIPIIVLFILIKLNKM
ncbi:MAG TPA: rhomboid family intramembrane serine protease [Flavobacterium sp.]|nr:rhomboid family intramembrane serine protease [Flavobacterium sp.]